MKEKVSRALVAAVFWEREWEHRWRLLWLGLVLDPIRATEVRSRAAHPKSEIRCHKFEFPIKNQSVLCQIRIRRLQNRRARVHSLFNYHRHTFLLTKYHDDDVVHDAVDSRYRRCADADASAEQGPVQRPDHTARRVHSATTTTSK